MADDGALAALDLTGVQPAAKEIVRATAEVFIRHTAPWLLGMIVHGSAFKGGYISGCSDVDLKLFLRDEAFSGPDGRLPLALAARIHADLAQIDPAPFQYIQNRVERADLAGDQLGPIPGAYRLLYGVLPMPEATEAQARASARAALDRLDPLPAYMVSGLLDSGGGRLERLARFVCTDVWPTLYQAVSLQQAEALAVWRLPKRAVIALLSPDSPLRPPIETFYTCALVYYGDGPDADSSTERALALIEQAASFFAATRAWWDAVNDASR